jgi:hypothetical protein
MQAAPDSATDVRGRPSFAAADARACTRTRGRGSCNRWSRYRWRVGWTANGRVSLQDAGKPGGRHGRLDAPTRQRETTPRVEASQYRNRNPKDPGWRFLESMMLARSEDRLSNHQRSREGELRGPMVRAHSWNPCASACIRVLNDLAALGGRYAAGRGAPLRRDIRGDRRNGGEAAQ